MNTYESLLTLSNLFKEQNTDITDARVVQAYRQEKETAAAAYMFCTHYHLFLTVSNKFFGLTSEDKDSFMLEEIIKAINNYDENSTSSAKLTTVISKYIYNRLRAETQAQQKASRITLNLATGFDDLGQEDRIEEAACEETYNYSEMYYLVSQLDLTDNERKCCELILLNNQELRNSELAELLGVSRAGVGHIKTRLKNKLRPIFEI